MGVAAGHGLGHDEASDALYALSVAPGSQRCRVPPAASFSALGALGAAGAPSTRWLQTAFAEVVEEPLTAGNPAAEADINNAPGQAGAGGPDDGKAQEGAVGTQINHPVDDLPWQLSVNIQSPDPAMLKPGGGIIPLDARRANLRDLGAQGGLDTVAMRKRMQAERKRRFAEGDEVADEDVPFTIGETAHQLMQSGDYGDGPPWPLRNPAPPPWRGTQPETGEVIFTETEVLGKGNSVEFIRCFKGTSEVPCGGCKGKEAEVDSPAEASMGGTGQLAMPSAIFMAAAGVPRHKAGRRRAREAATHLDFL